ncbi:uracil-DNA glycosylase family protein [Paraburkholderia sp. MPAMCS5]|uniref:uracil-DNA glycosylase n=1 Tax=Paraburkholderia sp. MPAMCS5 TaxID=3112563 RepID=UPI002E184FAA|nr:uracil-DNA glycosylase family protein [Paraburkholderia sp. MPAMCS5]
MALHESVLEEFGLATRWVRRGMTPAPEAAAEAGVQQEAAPVGAPQPTRHAGDAAHAQMETHGPVARATRTPEPAATRDRVEKTEPARFGEEAGQEARRARPAAQVAQSAQSPQPPQSRHSPQPPQPQPRMQPAAGSRDPHTAPSPHASEPASFDAPPDDGFAWFDDLPLYPPGDADASMPAAPAIHTLDWDTLNERVSACERCRLCEKRTKAVFGVGDRNADWMLIGEAPGENEDRVGEPFVGQAGKLLDNMLRSLTLARDANVYIANVIKCRPPGNRNPEPDEVARCEPYLQRQVALVKPKLIVALGRFAAQSLLKTDASISSLRGRVHEYEGVPVIVTYHPAYLLRSLPDKAKAWVDLCLARDTWRAAGGAPSDADQR